MWFLNEQILNSFAYRADSDISIEARNSFEAGSTQGFSLETGVAHIEVSGILTKAPDIMAFIFGGGNTVYSDIIESLAAAEQDEKVSSIVLDISSPGGQLDGLFSVLEAMGKTTKPISAHVQDKALSAAFALASAADDIVAQNRSTRFGSIGVAVSIKTDESIVALASTDAPNKRPDVTTEEGKAIVVSELDAAHNLFAEEIAKGRNTTVEKVNAEFGEGGTFFAEEALSRGMIDSISSDNKATVAGGISTQEGANQMDLKTLKSDHPDVFQAAVNEGVQIERDRVSAHMTLGEASGDMKTASEAIISGTGMTETVKANYMAASMRRGTIDARQEDDAELDAGDHKKGAQISAEDAHAEKVIAALNNGDDVLMGGS